MTTRRTFLQWLSAFGALASLPITAKARPSPPITIDRVPFHDPPRVRYSQNITPLGNGWEDVHQVYYALKPDGHLDFAHRWDLKVARLVRADMPGCYPEFVIGSIV